jgi:hypothetical protein
MENTGKDKNKKVVRRNLPINDTYRIIESYYTGGMESGDMECCENCNKLIANVAVVENSSKKSFHVGLDCAGTLSGIQNSNEYYITESNFREAKSLRAKINNHLKKKGNILKVENVFTGEIRLLVKNSLGGGCVNEWIKKDFFFTYLSDYKDKIQNPDKNDFQVVAKEEDLVGYDFSNLSYKTGFSPVAFRLHNLDVLIRQIVKTAPAGNRNQLFQVVISENGKTLKNDDFYMNRIIKSRITSLINQVYFERF